MTTAHIVQITFEVLAIVLLIVGFIYEEKVIDFEMAVRRIVIGNIRRWRRLHKKGATTNSNHLYLHNAKENIREEKPWYNYEERRN